MVAVWMVTYNHGEFIEKAIESVMMQKTTFQYKLFIGEDNSTDNTREICKKLQEKYPDKIELFFHEKNIGSISNGIFMYKKCFKTEAKYIALLEGDDFWTDLDKLQKQVDFLENNPDYVIHSGVAQVLKENKITEEYLGLENEPKTFTVENFYKQNNLVTCTVMFKNIIREFPKDFYKIIFGDWYLYTLLLKKSGLKAYRSKDVFSVYRIHSLGVMNSMSLRKNYKAHIDHIIILKRLTGYNKYPKDIAGLLNWYSLEKFKIELEQKSYLQMINTFLYNFYLVKFNSPIKSYLGAIKNKVL